MADVPYSIAVHRPALVHLRRGGNRTWAAFEWPGGTIQMPLPWALGAMMDGILRMTQKTSVDQASNHYQWCVRGGLFPPWGTGVGPDDSCAGIVGCLLHRGAPALSP